MESIRVVSDQLDFDDPEDEAQILARLDLMRRQPSLVARYLDLVNEMRLTMVEFVAERSGTDPATDMYPLLVAGASATAWDTSLTLWAASGGQLSLRELRRDAFDVLTSALPTPPPPPTPAPSR